MNEEKEKKPGQVKGGLARAEALTPEERKAIARKAALVRWDGNIPKASHDGSFKIGTAKIFAAVLPDGKRLLNQATFMRAIGRARSPKAGTGVLSTVDGTPFFLQAEALKSFISEDLLKSTTPIFFRDVSGKKMVGYDAELLPKVADVYLKMRDSYRSENKSIPQQYQHIIHACDVVMRGLAHVGIVGLVDEATGYQKVRDEIALQAILDQFLKKEFAAWAKRFPDEFYRQIFRLRKWTWKGMKDNRPQVVANYTKNIVYARLAPRILKELEKRNPIDENGRRKSKHHQWLTEDIGHPALAQHLHAVIGLMRASDSWSEFKRMLDRSFPKREDSLQMELFNDPADPIGTRA